MTSSIQLKHKNYKKIPGPKGWPLLGVAPDFKKDALALTRRLSKEYGNLVHVPIPGFEAYLTTDPDLMHTAFLETERLFIKSPFADKLLPVFGNGLVSSRGEFWRQQRKLSNPAFTKPNVNGFMQGLQKETEIMLRAWETKTKENPRLNIVDEMTDLTLSLILNFLFSVEIGDKARRIADCFHTLTDFGIRYFWSQIPVMWLTPGYRKFRRARDELDSIIYEIINERRNNPSGSPRHDLLNMLMNSVDEETGVGMTNKQLRDELMTLFFAGHDTTAHALSFTFHLLGKHPEEMQKVKAELNSVLGGRNPTPEDLPNLVYLRQVFDESLRLYPPGWQFPRTPVEDFEYKEHLFPANSVIFLSIYGLHRNPDVWERPESFEPDRFSPERSKNRHKHAYVPFGAGSRFCIGKNLAITESLTILAMTLQRFSFACPPDFTLELAPMLTLNTKSGIPSSVTLDPVLSGKLV